MTSPFPRFALLVAFKLGLAAALAAEPALPDLAALAPQARAIPAEAFFGLPNVRTPRLSPDGARIAFLFPHDGRMALAVFDRASNEAHMVLRGRDESIDDFCWKGNDCLLFLADFEGNEAYFIGATDLSGKKVRRIAESYGTRGWSGTNLHVVDWLDQDPDHIVIDGFNRWTGMSWNSSTPSRRVAKLNVRTGKTETVFFPPTGDDELAHVNFVSDGRAQIRFMTTVRQKTVKTWYRASNDDAFTELQSEVLDGYSARWSRCEGGADGREFYVISHEENDRGVLHAFDTTTRKLGPPIFVPPEGEIVELIWSPDGTRLVGVGYEGEKRHDHWLDADEGKLRRQLEASFPGLLVRVESASRDGRVRLVWVGSEREPGVYFVLDTAARSMVQFKRVRDGIDPRLMSPVRPISFTARDGLALHGYVTVPLAAQGKPCPLVVLPHGGPFGVRDSFRFESEVQFLASRGYAVLQVNYRGSGGYGSVFLQRGRRQWGRAMQDDLTDGVKWAIAEGIADPHNIAICGASYGGYAAMAGVTLTPELYRCAVNYVGVVDLEITGRPRGADAWLTSADFDYRAAWIGPTKEYRDATNPIVLADRIRVPTLHAYGRNDPRVQIDHWWRLESRLKKYGKPFEIIFNKHAGHGFDDAGDAVAFYQRVEGFLAKHLEPLR